MKLSDSRYEDIKAIVGDVYEAYNISSLPINVYELARKMDIKLIPYSSLSAAALEASKFFSPDGYSVEGLDSKWTIYYNDIDQPQSRINQTILHEIGHYILGHINPGYEEEAEAQFFAKFMLVSPAVIQHAVPFFSEEYLMDTFGISFQSANIALDNYYKRFTYGPIDYQPYEIKMLSQLGFIAANI